jgi:Arc/MetJ family transcription regulator
MDRTGQHGLEPILELLADLLGDNGHRKVITDPEKTLTRGTTNRRAAYTNRCIKVYDWRVSRTNIDIDDRLVAEVIRRYRLASKREAVELALRRLAGAPLSRAQALALEGSGWEGDLAEMRRLRVRSR